ncbi:MAG: antirestriction protein ArdA [Caldilineaceae bacterium]
MSIDHVTPRIYVACLAAYNNGKLHGVWIDALNSEPDEIREAVQAMLKTSPEPDAEDFAIHDYEGFAGVRLSEWESFEQVHMLAQFIDSYGELGAKLLSHCDNDVEDAKMVMDDDYAGCYHSAADFAEELTTETTQIPENLQVYIDYECMARDWEMSGDIFTIETAYDEVHIFWNR